MGTSSSGQVEMKGLSDSIENETQSLWRRHFLDSGNTLYYLGRAEGRKPASIRSAPYWTRRKPERRAKPITADYVGSIPDAFVVGYGLD